MVLLSPLSTPALPLCCRYLQVEAACHLYDKDHNDSLDREEFTDLLLNGGFGIPQKDVPALVEEADKNHDGVSQTYYCIH